MKFKFFETELEFDRKDAEIAIPAVLLWLTLAYTSLNKEILILLSLFYYLLYFFLEKTIKKVQRLFFNWFKLRCPHCKSRKVFLQGHQGYKSDEQYPYYFCSCCHEGSVLIDTGLIIPHIKKPLSAEDMQKNIDDFEASY